MPAQTLSSAGRYRTIRKAPAMNIPPIHLIIIGDEILSGKRKDRHMAKVLEILDARNMELDSVRYLRDERTSITASLRHAMQLAQAGAVVFSTGGIGATTDDHTRQCAAAAFEQPLQLHPAAQELIAQRIHQARETRDDLHPDPCHPDNEHIMNMGVLPAQAHIIPNPYNGIPGFYCTPDGRPGHTGGVYFFPGFPVMAWPMMEWVLDTLYPDSAGSREYRRAERSLILPNVPESRVTPLMIEVEVRFPSVKVFCLPSEGSDTCDRHIELGVKGLPDGVDTALAFLRYKLDAMNIDIAETLSG